MFVLIAFIILLSNCVFLMDLLEDNGNVTLSSPFKNDSSSESTLYGGIEASENEFNYMVYVIQYDREELCSGCLVSSNLILTAGHCIAKANRDYVMVAGGKSHLLNYLLERMSTPFDKLIGFKYMVEERKAWNIFVHPKYNVDIPYFADIGFIRVKYAFSKKLTPIIVATKNVGTLNNCTLVGWGFTDNTDSWGTLFYLSHKSAETAFENGKNMDAFFHVYNIQKNISKCPGDMGGPLVADGKVWGVASHTKFDLDDASTCSGNYQTIYTNLYPFDDWLNKFIYTEHDGGNALKPDYKIIVAIVCFISARMK